MPENGEIRFRSDSIFAGQTGIVDHESCVIRGVSIITGNLVAEGHNLHVDDTTLQQLQACAKSRGKIPVNLDHGTGVKDLNGYLTSFRMDGDKLRGDWHLLKTHDETPKMLERADVMPDCFGMSTAFKGPPKGVSIGGGKMAARCEKLLSVDCVTRPAANEGLFSAKVDTGKKGMAEENRDAEPTPAEMMKAIQELAGRFDKQDELNQQIMDQISGGDQEPTLDDFANATDEELAAFNKASGTNITRDEINAAVAEANAGSQEGEEAAGAEGEEAAGAEGAGAAEVSTAGGSGTALTALQKRVVELEAVNKKVQLKAKKDAEDHELSEIESKALTIATQRDEAIELAVNLKAENEALRLAIKTGTRPVKAGIDTGLRLFSANGEGELHEFQMRVKQLKDEGKTEAQAIQFAQKENPGLHADWVQSLRKPAAA